MDTVHHPGPKRLMKGSALFRNLHIGIIAGPDGRGIIRRVSGEHQIHIGSGGSRFSCRRHILQLQSRSCPFLHDAFHGAGQQKGCALTEYPGFLRGILQKHVSLLIRHPGIKRRFDIISLIGDSRISRRQFQVCDTVGDASQRQRLIRIRLGIQRRKSQSGQIVITGLGRQIRQHLHRRYIIGIRNSRPHGNRPVIGVVRIAQRRSIRVFIRFILNHRRQSNLLFLQSRSVSGQNLESRSRLTGGVGRPVERETGCLFPSAAHDSLHLPGALFDHRHGRLGLGGKINPLRHDGVLRRQNRRLVLIHKALRLILACEQQIKRSIALTEIAAQHLTAVIFLGTVCVFHGQRPLQFILHIIRIIFFLLKLFIHNRLNVAVLGAVNAQTAAVNGFLRFFFRISAPLNQMLFHLLDQSVHKVGIRLVFIHHRRLLNAGIHIVSQRFLLLFRCDPALLRHIAQHHLPALGVFLRVGSGIPPGGILRNGRQHGTFGQRQVFTVFSEISL